MYWGLKLSRYQDVYTDYTDTILQLLKVLDIIADILVVEPSIFVVSL
jgi:hypothetical protein